ncbi:hypothetical protein GOBAR_AA30890 [Gossypium barbadense]|uniref:Uncharacterized protein n=1 Tax=Gossypium barbadense TaxID=3634 RepID=A0A2P5WFD3_GOSBA|nr:hypothetical protein GOBAR_AA30890 [Gossypium barbadense]
MKKAHESFSSSSRGYIHEDRRLQIEELDEWRTHKSRTHDKPKLCQNELNTFPHQLKVGDKVVLDAADSHIVTTTPNEEIPLTVFSIFPFDTVEVSHPKFVTFKVPCHLYEERKSLYLLSRNGRERHLSRTVITNYDDPGTVQFCQGKLICQLSVPEFGAALGLYTEEFKEENELHALTRHIYFYPSKCWHTLALGAASYNLSRSKASVLPPSLSTRRSGIGRGVISIGPYHEDPLTQPPPPSRPVHAAASYADISERLTRFEQQCFQRFENIDATLQQNCQHLHISLPVPPREPSSDEDV